MKSVNASTVSPVSGGPPTSASSTSTSIGLKPRVQSSTPPSQWGIRCGGCPGLAPAGRRRLLIHTLLPPAVIISTMAIPYLSRAL